MQGNSADFFLITLPSIPLQFVEIVLYVARIPVIMLLGYDPFAYRFG